MRIDVSFACGCGRNIRESLPCPEPNLIVDGNSEDLARHDESILCEECGADYEISIESSSAEVRVYVNNGDVAVSYDSPYFEDDIDDLYDYQWYWINDISHYYHTLTNHLNSADGLLKIQGDTKTRFSLNVMIYGYVVAAIEGFLSSVFIKATISSNDLIRRLVETDPTFSSMKIPMSQIFAASDDIQETVAKYLLDTIFHDLKKIKPMYLGVLGHDFGDIGWLFRAISKRHHCVHRAGYNKEWEAITFADNEVVDLIENIRLLADAVMESVRRLYDEEMSSSDW